MIDKNKISIKLLNAETKVASSYKIERFEQKDKSIIYKIQIFPKKIIEGEVEVTNRDFQEIKNLIISQNQNVNFQILELKSEINNQILELKSEINNQILELKSEINNQILELKSEINKINIKLNNHIQEFKSEINKINIKLDNHIQEFKEFKSEMLSLPTIAKELQEKNKF